MQHLLLTWIVFLGVILPHIGAARIDPTAIPDEADYERTIGYYLGKFTLGNVIKRVDAIECSENCDLEERCMGFNYYTGGGGRCELLTHNQYTTPIKSYYRPVPGVDHYTRVEAEYQCPEGSFKHPYKARCYLVFNTKSSFYASRQHCRNAYFGELIVIPNRMEHRALWPEIQSRLRGDAWIGLLFRKNLGSITRQSQMSPFLWLENLAYGRPVNVNRQYSGMILEDGTFHYATAKNDKGHICEIRSHTDNELNELCPFDTALFDDHCYWSDGKSKTASEANDACTARGGHLAAFPSQAAIDFAGQAWYHIIETGDEEVWIGMEYDVTDDAWEWFDGDIDKHPALWNSNAERNEGNTEPCGTAVVSGNTLSWFSRDCEEKKESLCMGPSGGTYSRECVGDDPLVCPENSECREGFLTAKCVCNSGHNPVRRDGEFLCVDSAECHAWGDPHYTVFDGGKVTYQGKCRHLLAGPCEAQKPAELPSFKVIAFNDARSKFNPKVTFVIYLEVTIYGKVVKLGPGDTVLVDGHRRTPEFTIASADNSRYFTVTSLPPPNGLKLITDFGLSVKFQGVVATVEVPNDYMNIMCGICGNFNGDAYDDLGRNQHQWMDTDDDGSPACQTDDPYDEPDCEPDIQELAEERCGLINDMVLLNTCRFAEGFHMESYYSACLEDACGAGTEGGVGEVVCDTFEAIFAACAAAEHPISYAYRYETNCTYDCIPHSTYNPDMSLDVSTCQNPDAIYDTSAGYGEGCECDNGYILDAGNCVSSEDCGCLDNSGNYMEIGTVYVNSQCTTKTKCTAGNNLVQNSMQCAENFTTCVLGDKGIFECQCVENYTGDPLVECHHEDACPYPMPDTLPQSPDVGKLRSPLKVNSKYFFLDTVVIDPDRPTTDIWIDPDTWVLNPFCQNITCYSGTGLDIGGTDCVQNANCVQGGPNGFQCICEPGYNGDGTVKCKEDPSVTGDPHFVVTSHSTGDHLCYDAHGFNGDVWNLLEDKVNGVLVTGELFETEHSTKIRPQSFFSKITVRSREHRVIFSQTEIRFDKETIYNWNDVVDTWNLKSSEENMFEVIINDGIKLVVTKSFGLPSGFYLGVFISENKGLSNETTGMMGQFLDVEFNVVDITEHDDYARAFMEFKDDRRHVPVVLIERYNRMLGSMVDCWLYRASYENDQLLGSLANYNVKEMPQE